MIKNAKKQEKNLSKTYLNAFFDTKLHKNCNQEKLVFSLILLGFASYLPQHFLYFLPEPHGCGFSKF
jgi:hypothetical protein